MDQLAGKVAVVTGGASGIGLAIVKRCAAEGMKVVVADVEESALDAAVSLVNRSGENGGTAAGLLTDVSDQEAVNRLADFAWDTFGGVHVLCNNAGIGTDETRNMIWDSPTNDWHWAVRVNVWGVLHGIRAFVPRMLAQNQPGYVVNTSSGNGGLYPLPTTPIYATTKAAVTTISEVLHYQLQMTGAPVKAGVLYPGPNIVRTNIFDAARNRPDDLPYEKQPDAPPPTLDDIREMMEGAGMQFDVTEPEEVAEHFMDGIKNDRFWILPESERTDAAIKNRLEGILARRNPVLAMP